MATNSHNGARRISCHNAVYTPERWYVLLVRPGKPGLTQGYSEKREFAEAEATHRHKRTGKKYIVVRGRGE